MATVKGWIIGEYTGDPYKDRKIVFGSASVADGGTISTGLTSVDVCVLTSSNADHVAAVTSISGGNVTVGLHDNGGSAVTSAETVYFIAIGKA